VIPLFIMMGAFAERGGPEQALFAAANAYVGHRRGGMAMAAIGACTAFGAICGSSVATTATMGRAAYPELRRFGYSDRLATGTLAGGRDAGHPDPALDHPDRLRDLDRAEHREAVHGGPGARADGLRLLHAGDRLGPSAATPTPGRPARACRRRSGAGRCSRSGRRCLVALVVVGGIYGGVFTPPEGRAWARSRPFLVGPGPALARLGGDQGQPAPDRELSAMIFGILLGAEVFNAFLALSGLPAAAAELVADAGLSPYAVLVALLVFYIVLGGVMDELAMILLTLPVFFPVVTALDFGMDPEETAIWFGILVLVIVGIGLTAPPIGLNVFVINAIVRHVPITTTYRGVLPFLATDLVR
jgi:TRAP-type C4-dicarboxylate transport system permease large subunit